MYYLRLLLVFAGIYVTVCLLYYFFQEAILFFPEKLPEDYSFDYDAEEITIKNNDALINGLIFSPQDTSKGVIIYFHGNAGNLKGWGYWGHRLRKFGYTIVITDYRGYGKSRGRLSESNLNEDAQKIYDYVRQRYPGQQIIIMGRSLGSGVATDLATKVNFDKLILESPFHNFPGLAKMHFRYLPHQLILQYKFDNAGKASKIDKPVLILQGTDDTIVPLKSAEILVDSFNSSQLTFIKIKGGGHNNLSDFPEYSVELEKFLRQ